MKRHEKPTAVYCRVSHLDEFAINAQKDNFEQYAESQGYSDVSIYPDNGYSELNFERPAFLKMQKDIQDGQIQRVIVNSLSSICRDRCKLHGWLEEMQGMGLEVLAVDGSHMVLMVFE